MQASTFINPERNSWKCYPPLSLYLPSWNQSLPVSCYAHLCASGHVPQSTSWTKENISDPCPGTRVIASNTSKYLHCAELKRLREDVWREYPYVQTIINYRSSGCRPSFHPEEYSAFDQWNTLVGKLLPVCANTAKYFSKKSQTGVWISKHKKGLAWERTKNKLEFKMTQPNAYKKRKNLFFLKFQLPFSQ